MSRPRPGSPKGRADVWIGVYLGAVDAPSSNPWQAVIDVVGLVKSFGRTKALNRLNLGVAQGEVHKFLGPQRTNGASPQPDEPAM